jgi:hypothetical protein
MRSAELLQQPACGAGDDASDRGRSVRIDDHEPGRDAGVDPGRTRARGAARGAAIVLKVEGPGHVVVSINVERAS